MKLRIEKEHIRQFNSLLIGITSLEFWINSFFVDVLVQQIDSDKILGKIGNSDFENIEIQKFSKTELLEIGKSYRFKISSFKKVSPVVGFLSIITSRDKLTCNAVWTGDIEGELKPASKWLFVRTLVFIFFMIIAFFFIKTSIEKNNQDIVFQKIEAEKKARIVKEIQTNRIKEIESDLALKGKELVEFIQKRNDVHLPISNVRTQWIDSEKVIFNFSLVVDKRYESISSSESTKSFRELCDYWFASQSKYKETIKLVRAYQVKSKTSGFVAKVSQDEYLAIDSCSSKND